MGFLRDVQNGNVGVGRVGGRVGEAGGRGFGAGLGAIKKRGNLAAGRRGAFRALGNLPAVCGEVSGVGGAGGFMGFLILKSLKLVYLGEANPTNPSSDKGVNGGRAALNLYYRYLGGLKKHIDFLFDLSYFYYRYTITRRLYGCKESCEEDLSGGEEDYSSEAEEKNDG